MILLGICRITRVELYWRYNWVPNSWMLDSPTFFQLVPKALTDCTYKSIDIVNHNMLQLSNMALGP